MRERFDRSGEVIDGERAIFFGEEAVHLTLDIHHDKLSRLNNLGDSLTSRFERSGDLVDLDRSISYQEDALRLTGRPPG